MSEEISFEEKIRKQLLIKFEGTDQISPELIKDIYGDPESDIFRYWKSRADEMLVIVMNDYKQAQKMGWIRPNVKLEFILYMSGKTAEFASDPHLQAMYPSMQSLIMEIANFFFYGILPHKKE